MTPGDRSAGIRRSSPPSGDDLFAQASALIEEGRRVAASQANATLAYTHWRLGRLISSAVLGHERGDYGKQIVVSLSRQLGARYGRGFEEKNLRRMIQFAQEYPDEQIVVSLIRQLSWTHILALLPVKSDNARAFYVSETVAKGLGVRELRQAIARKAYERREIANAQIPQGSAVPRDTFTDPMILDLLGLHDSYLEKDLEAAILRGMQAFLMEVGQGFTFVASQKRMPVSGDTEYILDLLFFSRPLVSTTVELCVTFDGRIVRHWWLV